MKRATKVNKTDRGVQDPFSRQLANARKENARLREDCKAQLVALQRQADEHISEACAERRVALDGWECAERELREFQDLDADFARVAPALRSRSILRRLWWGLRFGLWGVFWYEVQA